MKKYERILSVIKESPLLKMIQAGQKPEEIKEAVIDSLRPYFENKDILEQLAIDALVPESINLLQIQKDEWCFRMFENCINTFRSAKSKDTQGCFESLANWQPQIDQSLSTFWSVLHLEVDKNILEIEEFLSECLSNIGDIIEGLTKPYLKVIFHQIKISNAIKISIEDIDSLDLGNIINELIIESDYPELFIPPPWGVKLSQWRNIAYHHTAKIENNKIICWYGKKSKKRVVELSRDALLKMVHTIYQIYKIIRLAHTLFFVDNLKEISKFSTPIVERSEAKFLSFVTAIASQGFEVVEYKDTNDETKIILKDVSDLDPKQRRIHASQFLFALWLINQSTQRVAIEYRENNNTPNFLVSVNSNICKKIYNGELDPVDIVKIMDMVDLKTKKVIPPIENDKQF